MIAQDGADTGRDLVRVRDLHVHFDDEGGVFRRGGDPVRAVDGVTFEIRRGETLGLVGESGCGKTTIGRALLRLYDATSGTVEFDGVDVGSLGPRELRRLRRRMQMVFQDPYSSLNPRQNVTNVVGEPLKVHNIASGKELEARVAELLQVVGLPEGAGNRYPHEFSGGQRQRIGLARALALNPDLIVADEPVSALDVSIQAQIVNLLEDLQEQFDLTYLFIAHDLAVVRHISDRIVVMYLGTIVEVSPARELYSSPLHPYTLALMSAVPIPDPAVELHRERVILTGDMPSPADPPPGCRFHTRCPYAQVERCPDEVPVLRSIQSSEHVVACHYAEDIIEGRLKPGEGTPLPAVADSPV
ncbi:MAG TPA: oligopeptide/dipeptide ABC transporter ATP-binding protein [Euzebya sp.]|nr:oligopeptide/dipeptide ABC transporter ATP-binding protein [Euzebya sp.]